MNILVLHTQVPYTHGGAEILIEGLAGALREREHRVDTVSLPLSWDPVDNLLTAALAWSLLDLSTFNGVDVDLVVCTKYPTWAVQHHRKVLWLIHQHRQAYDLHGTSLSDFSPEQESQNVRRSLMNVDRRGLSECSPRFAISNNVANRLARYNGIHATPLYPPVPREGLAPERFEPYFLCLSRIDDAKRVDMVVRAWKYVQSDVRLVIAGDGPALSAVRKLVHNLDLQHRVDVRGRVSDDEVRSLYNRCRGVIYTPVDEDYGYAAVEALAAGKPVITSKDSGGTLEFVRDGETGIVVHPDPMQIAQAVDELADEALSQRLGAKGPSLTENLTWDNVVSSLLGSVDARS